MRGCGPFWEKGPEAITNAVNSGIMYALYNGGNLALAFKTPANSSSGSGNNRPGGGGFPGGGGGGSSQQLVVYTSSTPTLKSGVSVSGGTEIFNGAGNIGGEANGGTSVTLSNYSGGWR